MTAPVIRTLTLLEVEALVSWAGEEGWNPGLADGAAFYAADPGGFLGVFVDGDGESFTTLNRRVYDELFLSPKGDPWLGLGPREVFSVLNPSPAGAGAQ